MYKEACATLNFYLKRFLISKISKDLRSEQNRFQP
jgi:hypothetical protein